MSNLQASSSISKTTLLGAKPRSLVSGVKNQRRSQRLVSGEQHALELMHMER
jgi:hypothetical protein